MTYGTLTWSALRASKGVHPAHRAEAAIPMPTQVKQATRPSDVLRATKKAGPAGLGEGFSGGGEREEWWMTPDF